MNEKIKQQAQSLYPPEEKASEYVAFMRGARMVVEQLMKFQWIKHYCELSN